MHRAPSQALGGPDDSGVEDRLNGHSAQGGLRFCGVSCKPLGLTAARFPCYLALCLLCVACFLCGLAGAGAVHHGVRCLGSFRAEPGASARCFLAAFFPMASSAEKNKHGGEGGLGAPALYEGSLVGCGGRTPLDFKPNREFGQTVV